jgi:hypothetical protein
LDANLIRVALEHWDTGGGGLLACIVVFLAKKCVLS